MGEGTEVYVKEKDCWGLEDDIDDCQHQFWWQLAFCALEACAGVGVVEAGEEISGNATD